MTQDEVIHAPLLRGVLERMREGGRWVILDLGPAVPGNLGVFRNFRCRLTIADAQADLVAASREQEPEPRALAGRLARLIPEPGDAPWDLVLCWDLVNYLSRPVLTGLMQHVGARLHPGSLVHAFVESSRPRMPAAPGRFEVHGDDRFRRAGPAEPDIASPRYSHWDLIRCWPECTAEKSVLLQSGVQEYLFRYR